MKNEKKDLLMLHLKLSKLLSVLGVLAFATPAQAQTPEQKGYEISKRGEESDRGYQDSRVELKMILRNANNQETSRVLTITNLEVPSLEEGDKSMVVFSEPADIDGTALLSHAKILDPDDQWLFLPALKRVKRISSVNKSGPFVGSELAFEDFTSQELGKYNYKYIGEDACGALMCDMVERYPLYEHSGYTKQIAWQDQDVHQVRKVDYYDRKGQLLKTLVFDDYREYDGGVWRSHTYKITNHQTGKSTDLLFSDYQFKLGLDDKDFVQSVLRRAR